MLKVIEYDGNLKEIAQKLNAPVKSVDNAIQRIRKKAIKNFF